MNLLFSDCIFIKVKIIMKDTLYFPVLIEDYLLLSFKTYNHRYLYFFSDFYFIYAFI